MIKQNINKIDIQELLLRKMKRGAILNIVNILKR